MEEIEIKFLEIDVEALEKKLGEIGAQKAGEYFYRRSLFDYPDLRLEKSGKWLRIRDEGDKVTMTSKSIPGFTSQEEIAKDVVVMEDEMTVGDFKTACTICNSIGLIEKRYEENRRIRYTYEGVEIDIDFWPKIPPFVEIEGPTLEAVEDVATKIGFNVTEAVRYGASSIYNRHYNIDLREYKKITFEEWIKK